MDEGVLLRLEYGAGIGGGVHAGRFEAGIEGILWLPQRADAPGAPQFGGLFERRSARVRGCVEWAIGRFDLGPCLNLTLESMTGSGRGPDVVAASGTWTWLSVGAEATARWFLLRRIALVARPSIALPTSRPSFVVGDVGLVRQVGGVAAGGALGLEWFF